MKPRHCNRGARFARSLFGRLVAFRGGMPLPWLALVLTAAAQAAAAASPGLEEAFGNVPEMWGARLSPSGAKISFLHMDTEADLPIVYVADGDGAPRPVLASIDGRFDITWCDWVNETRLLCGFRGIDALRGTLFPVTRLVAVNDDGSDAKVLLQGKLRDEFTQYQDEIIDWLPDDPERVLIEMPGTDGTGVSRLNVYSGGTEIEERVRRSTRDYMSDGYGVVRLRHYMTIRTSRWYFRLAGERKWQQLREVRVEDLADDAWVPLGFGADRNSLIVVKPSDGRLALWAEDLTGAAPDRLIYAHPEVDIGGTITVGKHNRLVAVGYSTDKPNYHFFDERISRIIAKVAASIPETIVSIIDESWDERFYLVRASSDTRAGRYYRLDNEQNSIAAFWPMRPGLQGYELVEMQPASYPARDGEAIPAYLTVPPASGDGPQPAVMMPHGGPESRDVWDFDWLTQYLAFQGFIVLRPNFRGSGGYGESWAGEGGFRAWRLAVGDIVDGARWLIDAGLADPQRICIVGWSYGGYAALMSAIEEPELFQCVVSIAPVTDPWSLIYERRSFIGGKASREYIGTDDEVIDAGSPLRRADELRVPVLLFHGDRDINVSVDHSRKMNKALKKAKVEHTYIEYEDIEHSIWRNNYRVDMLKRVGAFLAANTATAR